jgi:hypothetical protein
MASGIGMHDSSMDDLRYSHAALQGRLDEIQSSIKVCRQCLSLRSQRPARENIEDDAQVMLETELNVYDGLKATLIQEIQGIASMLKKNGVPVLGRPNSPASRNPALPPSSPPRPAGATHPRRNVQTAPANPAAVDNLPHHQGGATSDFDFRQTLKQYTRPGTPTGQHGFSFSRPAAGSPNSKGPGSGSWQVADPLRSSTPPPGAQRRMLSSNTARTPTPVMFAAPSQNPTPISMLAQPQVPSILASTSYGHNGSPRRDGRADMGTSRVMGQRPMTSSAVPTSQRYASPATLQGPNNAIYRADILARLAGGGGGIMQSHGNSQPLRAGHAGASSYGARFAPGPNTRAPGPRGIYQPMR